MDWTSGFFLLAPHSPFCVRIWRPLCDYSLLHGKPRRDCRLAPWFTYFHEAPRSLSL